MNNTLVLIVIGVVAVYVGYNFYARRIDRVVIESNSSKATPARLYMDGVDFVPTSRNVLYGYHFKSIAAAGPIVGAITAGTIWGWVPSIVWLVLGVVFMGWASDYSAIVVSVRNDGNSLSATAHRLIAPRTRQILLLVTAITVGGTLLAVLLNADPNGPVASFWKGFNGALNSLAPGGMTTVLDPTRPPDAQNVPVTVSFIFWLLFLFGFCYLGAILPIWRYAQPVNYIGFWITALTIVLGGLGALLAFFIRPDISVFKLGGFSGFNGNPSFIAAGAIQPLWPMLFVTIACGAISGWHALIGSVGTARQIENETDMLPVGGGAMFSEFALGLLSLLAVSIAAQPAPATDLFAQGVGGFLSVFGIP